MIATLRRTEAALIAQENNELLQVQSLYSLCDSAAHDARCAAAAMRVGQLPNAELDRLDSAIDEMARVCRRQGPNPYHNILNLFNNWKSSLRDARSFVLAEPVEKAADELLDFGDLMVSTFAQTSCAQTGVWN